MSIDKPGRKRVITFGIAIAAALITAGLTACSSTLATPDSESKHSSRTIETTSPFLVLSKTPSPMRSRTAPSTKTPSATLTSMPTTVWTIPVIEIADWPGVAYDDYIQWEDNESISFWDYHSPFTVNAVTGVMTPEPTMTPYRYDQMSISSQSKDYEIHCLPNGLEMYRISDQSLISQTPVQVYDCGSIQWSNNGNVASLVSDQGRIYVWPSDGTLPYVVGQTTPYTLAEWSTNDQMLLIFNMSQNSDEGTFDIAFADGRPMKITGATIEAGNGWEIYNLRWLTNDIVINMRQCGNAGACQSYSYFDAMTGEYLIGYIVDVVTQDGQFGSLSPNHRWLTLDTYMDEDVWEKRYSYDNRVMVFYDLEAHKKYVWAEGDDSIKFAGWSPDSNTFYFVHFPFDSKNINIPSGYLVIKPDDLHARLVIPNVLNVEKSPDGQLILVGMGEKIEEQQAENITVSLFTVDGRQLSASQFIADRLDYEMLRLDNLPMSWSNDSSKAALVDASGNLWIFNKDGIITRVASSLPTDFWPGETYIKWSPDNDRLLVVRHNRAWIATVP